MSNKRNLVEDALDRIMPRAESRPADLHAAMRYSVLNGGKRIRAILCIAACEAAGGVGDDALIPACALELLHAYTLVHDDLPAMDDDDMRRGKPSCHKVYGEAEAILAGDALLTLSFELLAGMPRNQGALALELARVAGSRGVIGGQFEDVRSEDGICDRETLEFIQTHKTADLIRGACRMGGIVAGANDDRLRSLDTYGHNVGIAFQLIDDILDETGLSEVIGKPTGSDRDNMKMTAITLYGVEGARDMANRLIEEARHCVKKMPGYCEPLVDIADLVVSRDR